MLGKQTALVSSLLFAMALPTSATAQNEWRIADALLLTPWAEKVGPQNPLARIPAPRDGAQ